MRTSTARGRDGNSRVQSPQKVPPNLYVRVLTINLTAYVVFYSTSVEGLGHRVSYFYMLTSAPGPFFGKGSRGTQGPVALHGLCLAKRF